jgi:hypothetical protein
LPQGSGRARRAADTACGTGVLASRGALRDGVGVTSSVCAQGGGGGQDLQQGGGGHIQGFEGSSVPQGGRGTQQGNTSRVHARARPASRYVWV